MSKTTLFFNHYQCDSVQRQSEIDMALYRNRQVFDRVIVVEGRPTFSELLAMSKDYPDDINVYCNSDIYFPDVSLLHKIKEGEFFWLTRWDIKKGKEVFFNRRDSADSFIFRGEARNMDVPYHAGMWGIDNRIAHEAQKAGYIVTNPSWSIKTIHLHGVDNRNHVRTSENTVPPPYSVIEPTIFKL